MKDLISVIIPAFNAANTIGTALDSICHQTYVNLEIIVIDDNSTDNTLEVVAKWMQLDHRIKYFKINTTDPHKFNRVGRNINAGYSARNFGFKQAKGAYITFQDADDASLINRIETQIMLLKKHNATHVTLDWIQFDEKLLGKKFNLKEFVDRQYIGPEELTSLASKSKGLAFCIPVLKSPLIPFEIKTSKIINRLYFGSTDPYPGTGNSPLFERKVIDKVLFRDLPHRKWPSFVGRGADRDFNFQVALTFKNSYVFFLPLYMWRAKNQNARYIDGIEKYLA